MTDNPAISDIPAASLLRTERHGGEMPSTWLGMRFATLWRTLAAGGFDISLNCLPRVALPAAITPLNSLAAALTELRYGRAIDAVELEPPVFVIGHWRTGTTLLHELLAEDPELAAPTVYQTFFPNAFLIAPNLGARMSWLLTPTRPFDNVLLGHDRPSEEEFALLNMGLGTPYQSLAYPRHGMSGLSYVDLSDLDDAERAEWETGYVRLLKRLRLAAGKRLLLKSPLHTGRIATLSKLFPGARFVHAARNPYDIFPSIVHTWKVLGSWQGFHNPGLDDESLKQIAFEMFERLFEAYERDRGEVPPGHIVEVRYEDLVADPEATLERIYGELSLGDFARARRGVRAYLDARTSYKRNKFSLSNDDRERVARRWAPYFERFGYAL